MIPKFHEFFYPILNLMSDGKPRKRVSDSTINHMVQWAKTNYKTTDEEVKQKHATGEQTIIQGRVGWAFSYLKQAELIEKAEEKFHYKITQKGIETLKQFESTKSIALKWLKENTKFLENRAVKTAILGGDSINENIEGENQSSVEEEFNLEEYIDEITAETKKDFVQFVRTMEWQAFEDFCLDLLEKMGYGKPEYNQVKVADGGIDGKIYGDKLRLEIIYLQAKRFKEGSNVTPKDMKEFCYNVGQYAGNKGVFITTSHFSKEALKVKEESKCLVALIDIDKLFDLCCQHEHYIKHAKKTILKFNFEKARRNLERNNF